MNSNATAVQPRRARKAKKKVNLSNKSQWGLIMFRFSKNKLAMFGLSIVLLIILLSFLAPLFIPYSKVVTQELVNRFQSPNPDHWFGTDQYGRDMFARMIYGGRISLVSGLAVVLMSVFLGLLIGAVAGYYGGLIDNLLMRFCDIFMAVPGMLLAMAVVAALGQGTVNMLIALCVTSFPRFARTIRGSVLTLRGQEFVEAAQCHASSSARILIKHIIPNGLAPILVSATMQLGGTILTIASLGFLGIGISPPTPEWGTILSENRANLRYYPYLGLIPGAFIAVAVMCLNFAGDGLRDALDPRTKH